MKNATITKVNETYYILRADTERFGKNEILFEGTSYEQVEKYALENGAVGIWVVGMDKIELDYNIRRLVVKIADKLECSYTATYKISKEHYDCVGYGVVKNTMARATNKWMVRVSLMGFQSTLNGLYKRMVEVGV